MKKKKKIKEKLYETFWLIIAMTWGILSISVVGWLIYISGAWKIIVSMGMFAVIIGGGLLILAIAAVFSMSSWTWFTKTSFGSWFNKKTSVGTKTILIVTLAIALNTAYKIYNTKLIPFMPSKIICELSAQQIPKDYDSKSAQFKKNYPVINFPQVINLKFNYSKTAEVSTIAKDFFASGKWKFETRKNKWGSIFYEFETAIPNKIPYYGLCRDGTICEGINFSINGEDEFIKGDNGEKINMHRTMYISYMMETDVDAIYDCWKSKI